ncbi:fumarate hydratase, partial [Thermoplasmatales archaeon ex4572_165]
MIKEFTLPLKKDELNHLSVGDIVYLSGKMFTGRDEAHRLLLKDENISIPFNPSEMALYHCGPLMEKKGKKWNVISAGPTTSSRMDGFSSDFIDRFSIHA